MLGAANTQVSQGEERVIAHVSKALRKRIMQKIEEEFAHSMRRSTIEGRTPALIVFGQELLSPKIMEVRSGRLAGWLDTNAAGTKRQFTLLEPCPKGAREWIPDIVKSEEQSKKSENESDKGEK